METFTEKREKLKTLELENNKIKEEIIIEKKIRLVVRATAE